MWFQESNRAISRNVVKYLSFRELANFESSFCRRNRALADSVTSNPHYSSPYSLSKDVTLRNGLLTGTILKSIKAGVEKVELPLTIQFLKSGVARVTIDEKRRQHKDIELPEGKSVRAERYNAVANT